MALIAIGSTSEIKFRAVRDAILFPPNDDQDYSDYLDFEAIPEINSGVRDAPDGDEETALGALNRARAAARASTRRVRHRARGRHEGGRDGYEQISG